MTACETYSFILFLIVLCCVIVRVIKRRYVKPKQIFDLRGKKVLITGATSGIGQSLAKQFFGIGCKLVLAGRDINKLNKIKEDLCTMKIICKNKDDEQLPMRDINVQEPSIIYLDLSMPETIVSAADSLKQRNTHDGVLDMIINCGGISQRGSVMDTEMSVHREIMDINYFGAVLLTKELLPTMISRNGNKKYIVNISSLQGCLALPERSAYSASKHALQAFSDSLRAEMRCSGKNVHVMVVNPGYVSTNLSLNARAGDGTLHNKMDKNTENGYDPDYVALEIINSLCLEDEEVFVARLHHVAFIYLRRLLPTLAMRIVEARAVKGITSKLIYLIKNLFFPNFLYASNYPSERKTN